MKKLTETQIDELYQLMSCVEDLYYDCKKDEWLVTATALAKELLNVTETTTLTTEYPLTIQVDGEKFAKLIGISCKDGVIYSIADKATESDGEKVFFGLGYDDYSLTILLKRLYLALTDEYFMKRTCPHCGRLLSLSECVDYSYLCKECDEDFYICETDEPQD